MDFTGKKVLVAGMAKSGIASAKLLCALGADVTVTDRKSEAELGDALDGLLGLDVTRRLGEDGVSLVAGMDMLVLSPGIPSYAPFVLRAKELGVNVIGEIELGYLCLQGTLIAITGTNGKTTTTALTGRIFEDAGYPTHTVGNIGVPITSRALVTKPGDVIVAETAALQLETTEKFHPHISAFLNITPDHLDRYGNMETYIAAKYNIYKNQNECDYAVLNYDDETVRVFAQGIKAKVLYFSREVEVEEGAFTRDGNVFFRLNGRETKICSADEIRIRGAHNLENALAAVACAGAMGVPAESVRFTLRTFAGVEHRIEFVREVRGVRFINDSKGTNPDSTIKAVLAMDRPTVLILGGYDKHLDFLPLFQSFTPLIKSVVALGETADAIMEAAKAAGFEAAEKADGFEEAVLKAYAKAEEGYNVLLSPACASYDMFKNFEERGETFKRIVNGLEE